MLALHYTAVLPAASLAILAYASLAGLTRGRKPGRAARIGFALAVFGWLVYWVPFVTLDFSLHEVFWNTSPGLPVWMRLASAWSGGGGSLYLFATIASLAGLYLVGKESSGRMVSLVSLVVVVGLVAAFFNKAFTLLPSPPAGGAGLNPLLKSFWLYPHPLLTFSGYALLAVASAALISGENRRGLMLYELGWSLLTLGILVGAYWSYETFGWGGYWAWDPVETSELMVWLVATLLGHIAASAPSLSGFSCAWLLSSVFAAMYVTRTGLSPLHSFAGSNLGALSLLAAGLLSLAYAVWQFGGLAPRGGRELLSSVRGRSLYRAGLAVATLALLASALLVYSSLFVPALASAAGSRVSVPQMEAGARFYNPPLYVLLVLMLASLPAVFLGGRLSWRGYAALLLSSTLVSSAMGAAAYTGRLAPAPLSPAETNVMIAFGVPWALLAAFSAATYLVLALRRGLRALSERMTGLSLLHLGLAITALGILLSGTYAFSQAYFGSYTLKPGQPLSLPGGLSLVLEGYNFSMTGGSVDIRTQYLGRSASYYYGQLALQTLSQDIGSLVRDYEEGRALASDTRLVSLLDAAMSPPRLAAGVFTAKSKGSLRLVDIAANESLPIAEDAELSVSVSNASLSFRAAQSGASILLRPSIMASRLSINSSRSFPREARLGVHELLVLRLRSPLRIEYGNTTLLVREATLVPEALVSAGRGKPILVENHVIEGVNVLLDVVSGYLVLGSANYSVPVEVPRPLVVYELASRSRSYQSLISELRASGLYALLENGAAAKLASCSSPGPCRGYVDSPTLVPEGAKLDLVLALRSGLGEERVRASIRFEAYGEVQGIHGLVPKVLHPGSLLDEVYIVVEPPSENSRFYSGIVYHELLLYYLHEAFKTLSPEKRLALAAVMAGGYHHDVVRTMSLEDASLFLENSLVDLYYLASRFNPANSSIAAEGLSVKVKIVPGVRLVWIGPVIMSLSTTALMLLRALEARRAPRTSRRKP